jgi:hypothetical protein
MFLTSKPPKVAGCISVSPNPSLVITFFCVLRENVRGRNYSWIILKCFQKK